VVLLHRRGFKDDGFFGGLWFCFIGALNNGVDRSQILLPDDPWFSVNPFGFNGVIVWSSFFGFLDDGSHVITSLGE
jgi:hypothetical protein